MTSPAKNCSILLCALLLMAAGCKKSEQEPEPQPQPAQTLSGDIARPAWTAPTRYDMTSSMTAVVKVDLKAQYPDKAADFVLDGNDLLAAFSGETCLGTAPLQDGLFYLYIASPTSNSEAVTLRYYSAHYKNLFEAKDAFPFVNDDRLGTFAEPLAPSFVVVK